MMHPAFWSWLRTMRASRKCGDFGGRHGCGPGAQAWQRAEEGFEGEGEGGFGGGGGLGVRRPLRFLAHKLNLDERQVTELARILNELKTERAQAEVDRQRTLAAFADALTGDAFDTAKAGAGGDLRAKSAEHLRDAVLKALQQTHAILNPDQRGRLAHLIRTGTLVL
jgi:Spy/CpxP family protein refolding chaperone